MNRELQWLTWLVLALIVLFVAVLLLPIPPERATETDPGRPSPMNIIP